MKMLISKAKVPKEYFIFLGIALLLPVFVRFDSHLLHIFIMSFIWAVVACNWDLIMGYTGIFSFGQIAFFTFGAYTSGILTRPPEAAAAAGASIPIFFLGISPWLGILAGGCVAAVAGFIIGLPCLRLKGIYVALVTFALHEALITLIKAGRAIGTGGATNITGIPPLSIGDYVFSAVDRLQWYYVALALGFLVFFIVYRIIHSSTGSAFIALHDAEAFAKSLGIDAYKYSLMVFTVSAFFTGIAGGFYAHYMRVLSPRLLGLDNFVLVLIMVIVGGLGKFPGSVAAAFIFTYLNEFLRPLDVYRTIILGALVIGMIILVPGGVGEALQSATRYIKQVFKGRILKE